jgi:hypothetical protein
MHEPNDQDWLEALAGRKARNENSAAANTGKALREAYLARPDQTPSSVEAPKPDFQKLLNRARAEGLLADQSERREGPLLRRHHRRIQGLLAIAATVIVAVGLILLLHPIPGVEAPFGYFPESNAAKVGLDAVASPVAGILRLEVLRSPVNGKLRIESAQPEKMQHQMLADFQSLGVQVKAYEELGIEGIDADIPSPIDEKLRSMLRKYGIAAPTGGDLDIQIVRKEAR